MTEKTIRVFVLGSIAAIAVSLKRLHCLCVTMHYYFLEKGSESRQNLHFDCELTRSNDCGCFFIFGLHMWIFLSDKRMNNGTFK